MNKFSYLLATTALAGLVALPTTADAQSAKAAARTDNNIHVVSFSTTGLIHSNVLRTDIKTANKKDLFIWVSLQCGLSTNTKIVTDQDELKSTRTKAVADAEVQMRLRVTGPGHAGIHPNPTTTSFGGNTPSVWVTMCKRNQTLEGFLGKAIFCTESNGTSGIQFDECDVSQDQDIELTLTTLTATAFNFVVEDMEPGDHTVRIDIRLINSTINSPPHIAVQNSM